MAEIQQLRQEFEAIRDERRVHANTAARIGEALLALLDLANDSGDFLSRVKNDTANGVITFLKGLLVGNGTYGIDKDGVAKLANLITSLFNAESGVIGSLEVHDLTVTGLMEIFRLLVRQVSSTSGDLVQSAAGSEIETVVPVWKVNGEWTEEVQEREPDGWKCRWRDNDGKRRTRNTWLAGDQALCHSDNMLEGEGQYEGVTNKHYWRLVEEVGNDYVILSASSHEGGDDYNTHAGHIPAPKDNIVQFGYQPQPDDFDVVDGVMARNAGRTSVTVIGSNDDGPYVGVWTAITDFTMLGVPFVILDGQQVIDPRLTFFTSRKHHYVNSENYCVVHNGVAYPMVIDMGDWIPGSCTGHKYERWTFDGCRWQCLVTTTEDPIVYDSNLNRYVINSDKWTLMSGTPTLTAPLEIEITSATEPAIPTEGGPVKFTCRLVKAGREVEAGELAWWIHKYQPATGEELNYPNDLYEGYRPADIDLSEEKIYAFNDGGEYEVAWDDGSSRNVTVAPGEIWIEVSDLLTDGDGRTDMTPFHIAAYSAVGERTERLLTVFRPARDGEDGRSLTSSDVMFGLGESASVPPADDEFFCSLLSEVAIVPDKFVWSAVKNTYSDGAVLFTGKQCLYSTDERAEATELYMLTESNETPSLPNMFDMSNIFVNYGGMTRNGDAVTVSGGVADTFVRIRLAQHVTQGCVYSLHVNVDNLRDGAARFFGIMDQTVGERIHIAKNGWNRAAFSAISDAGENVYVDGNLRNFILLDDIGAGLPTETKQLLDGARFSDFCLYSDDYLGGWSESYEASEGKYLWSCVKLRFEDRTIWYTNPVCGGYFGKNGLKGDKGDDGLRINLLDQTAFGEKLDRWNIKNGEVDVADKGGGQRSWNYVYSVESNYRDVLQQTVRGGDISRIDSVAWYTLSFWCKGSGALDTYCYSSVGDNSTYDIADGVQGKKTPSDCRHQWALTGEWTYHTYTFHTRELDDTTKHVLFRLLKSDDAWVKIAAPKLEEGKEATPWMPSAEDMKVEDGKPTQLNLLDGTAWNADLPTGAVVHGWTIYTPSSTHVEIGESPVHGTRSISVTTNETGGSIFEPRYFTSDLKPSTRYVFSLYLKSSDNNRIVRPDLVARFGNTWNGAPSAVDPDTEQFRDGELYIHSTKSQVVLYTTTDWVRHDWSFKTADSLGEAVRLILCSNAGGHTNIFAALKLEEDNGTHRATPWTPSIGDLKGESVLSVDLENEMDTIPTKRGAGDAVVAKGAYDVMIPISVHYGTVDVKSDCTVKLMDGTSEVVGSLSVGCITATITNNKNLLVQADNGASIGEARIPITVKVTHGTFGQRTATFTLVRGLPGEAVYNIVTNAGQIRKNKNNELSPATLEFSVLRKHNGGVTTIRRSNQNNGEAYLDDYGLEVWYKGVSQVTYAKASGVLTMNTSISCIKDYGGLMLELRRTSDGTVLDRETVPIVEDGLDGVSITGANVVYAVSESSTEVPASFDYDTVAAILNAVPADSQSDWLSRFIWEATSIIRTGNVITLTGQRCIGKLGDISGGEEQYAVGESGTEAPSGGWYSLDVFNTQVPESSRKGKWTWTRTVYQRTSGGELVSAAVCVGYNGVDGVGTYAISLDNDNVNIGLVKGAGSSNYYPSSDTNTSGRQYNVGESDIRLSTGDERATLHSVTLMNSDTEVITASDNTAQRTPASGYNGDGYFVELTKGHIKVTFNPDVARGEGDRVELTLRGNIKMTDVWGEEHTFYAYKVITFLFQPPGADGVSPTAYELYPSVQGIVRHVDGTVTPSKVTCQIKKFFGTEQTVLNDGGDGLSIKYSINGGSQAAYPSSGVTVNGGTSSLVFYLMKSGTQIDSETIEVVKDGNNGLGGQNAYDVRLTNQCDTVTMKKTNGTCFPVNGFNVVQTSFECDGCTVDTVGSLKVGGVALAYDEAHGTYTIGGIAGCVVQFYTGYLRITFPTDVQVQEGKRIDIEVKLNVKYLKPDGTYGTGVVTKIFTVLFIAGGDNPTRYQLDLTPSTVQSGVNASIRCAVVKQTETGYSRLTTKSNLDSEGLSLVYTSTNYSSARAINTSDLSVSVLASDTSFRVELQKGGTTIDTQNICFSGKNGGTGPVGPQGPEGNEGQSQFEWHISPEPVTFTTNDNGEIAGACQTKITCTYKGRLCFVDYVPRTGTDGLHVAHALVLNSNSTCGVYNPSPGMPGGQPHVQVNGNYLVATDGFSHASNTGNMSETDLNLILRKELVRIVDHIDNVFYENENGQPASRTVYIPATMGYITLRMIAKDEDTGLATPSVDLTIPFTVDVNAHLGGLFHDNKLLRAQYTSLRSDVDSNTTVVNQTTADITSMGARLTATENTVSSQGARLSTAESNITANANNISACVKKTDYNNDKSSMQSQINLKASSAQLSTVQTQVNGLPTKAEVETAVQDGIAMAHISADQIALHGYTTVNGKLRIDFNGNLFAEQGTFGGMTKNQFRVICKGNAEEFGYFGEYKVGATNTYKSTYNVDVDKAGACFMLYENRSGNGALNDTTPLYGKSGYLDPFDVNEIHIRLPFSVSSPSESGWRRQYDRIKARGYVGKTITLYNRLTPDCSIFLHGAAIVGTANSSIDNAIAGDLEFRLGCSNQLNCPDVYVDGAITAHDEVILLECKEVNIGSSFNSAIYWEVSTRRNSIVPYASASSIVYGIGLYHFAYDMIDSWAPDSYVNDGVVYYISVEDKHDLYAEWEIIRSVYADVLRRKDEYTLSSFEAYQDAYKSLRSYCLERDFVETKKNNGTWFSDTLFGNITKLSRVKNSGQGRWQYTAIRDSWSGYFSALHSLVEKDRDINKDMHDLLAENVVRVSQKNRVVKIHDDVYGKVSAIRGAINSGDLTNTYYSSTSRYLTGVCGFLVGVVGGSGGKLDDVLNALADGNDYSFLDNGGYFSEAGAGIWTKNMIITCADIVEYNYNLL